MLNTVEVYSSSQLAEAVSFNNSDFIENDFVHVINIDGLDPVTASIDVVSSGNVDGAISLDTQVPTRNIVMTLRPNPDWTTWTYEQIRKLIYSYFIPKTDVKLIFDSDEIGTPVEIVGVVESCSANPFTKDPEYAISLICADPYFATVDPIVATGSVIDPSNWSAGKSTILNKGSVPIGIELKLPVGFNAEIYVQTGDSPDSTFHVIDVVTGVFAMNSIPLHKFIKEINSSDGSFVNLLSKLQLGSQWPVLEPGINSFAVMGPSVGFPWELTYHEKYGGV
jgi:Phage tail protein RIFT-related domain